MISLDTNILIRFVTRDDEKMAQRAYKIITERCTEENPGFVSTIVLVELVWTLKSHYGYEKSNIVRALESLISAKELCFEYHEAVQQAYRLYLKGTVGFADALIGIVHRNYGCDTTVTFDKQAAKLAEFSEG